MELNNLFVAEDADNYRICGTCNQSKPVEEFYKDGKDSNGKVRYRRDCKDCYKKTRIDEAKFKKGGKHNALPVLSGRPR